MAKQKSSPPDDVLYAFETEHSVSLQFNHDSLQSVMRKQDPYALAFEYTQVMMGFMPLLSQTPEHLLLIGLGGGSLSKFCYKHYPNTRVTTVEISAEVIAYRHKFKIPANTARFKVIEADGAVYVQDKVSCYEIILLDAYTGQGLPDAVASETFYHHCYQALKENGILVVNLWRKDPYFRRNLARLERCFDNKVLTVKCQSGNEIVFAFKKPQLEAFDKVWKRALSYQQQTQLNLPQCLEDMVLSLKNDWFYQSSP
ncbi:methyltransferase [Agitococcus lubricus]|uniref:Spermidine synthase n=1 Tax=Agitococcus lubricus TaxID=1077255 RepID=A0A2T5J054_9GAMM|nr:methyltransferase [Agitococcus lubricus]PTQ89614.1 spermidine synthase [Agitococcus lubricus]